MATVIDLGSRRVVGWATADHLRTDLIDHALTNAITSRRPDRGVIFHSDRGSTPASSTGEGDVRSIGCELCFPRVAGCGDEESTRDSRKLHCTVQMIRDSCS
jgi:transposase InsO family protein